MFESVGHVVIFLFMMFSKDDVAESRSSEKRKRRLHQTNMLVSLSQDCKFSHKVNKHMGGSTCNKFTHKDKESGTIRYRWFLLSTK